MKRGFVTVTIAGVLMLGVTSASQTPFRARTDVVRVDVLVKANNRPVTDLTAPDFELRDNGVVQAVRVDRADVVPVDLTLVLDLSGSAQSLIDDFKDDVREIARLLRSEDQVRLLAFGGTTVEVFGFQPGTASVPLERLERVWGATALDDALLLALAWMPEPSRRHLVAVFTDGRENASFVERRDLLAAATRAPGMLQVVLPRAIPVSALHAQGTLQAVAEASGGSVTVSTRSSKILEGFKIVFETFRRGYVLHYSPQGVPLSGWHDVDVRVTRPGAFDVRARRGYVGQN